jgi:hypothetical protein
MIDRDPGWHWLDEAAQPSVKTDPSDEEKSFARIFAGADGNIVLAHLRKITSERALGPHVTCGELRHLEGQRYLVAHIHALAARGGADMVEGRN